MRQAILIYMCLYMMLLESRCLRLENMIEPQESRHLWLQVDDPEALADYDERRSAIEAASRSAWETKKKKKKR